MNKIIGFFCLSFVLSIGNMACMAERKDVVEEPVVGVALYSFNRFSFQEGIEKARMTGVGFIEGFSFHRLGGKFGDRTFSDLSDAEIEEVKHMLAASQIEMVSMYADGKTLGDWEQLFHVGKKLGLQFLVGEPEPQLWDGLNEIAGQHNMKLAIHQHARGVSRFWHPDSVLTALQGREHFKVCGDLGHWVRSGLDPVVCLKALQGHLISVHAKDLDVFGDLNATDVKVGQGVIDYEAVIQELDSQKFNGHIFVECEHDWENNYDDVKAAVSLILRLTSP